MKSLLLIPSSRLLALLAACISLTTIGLSQSAVSNRGVSCSRWFMR